MFVCIFEYVFINRILENNCNKMLAEISNVGSKNAKVHLSMMMSYFYHNMTLNINEYELVSKIYKIDYSYIHTVVNNKYNHTNNRISKQ